MKKLYLLVKFKFRLFITLLLCFFALYVAGGRYLLYILPDYKGDMELLLSAALSTPVQIGSVEGHWSRFDPEIRLNDLRIGRDSIVSIEAASLRFGFLASIKARDLRFKSLEFLQTRLPVKESETGWALAGFSLSNSSTGEDDDVSAVRAWFDGANIAFIESHVLLEPLKSKAKDWRLPSVSLNYHDDEVFASGQVVHQSSLQPVLHFSFHGDGVLTEEPVLGKVFLEARSLHFLDSLLSVFEWRGIGLNKLDASGRVWVDFEGFELRALQGDLQVKTLDWRVANKAQAPIKNLATRFRWRADEERRTLSFHNLAWQWNGKRCESGSGQFSRWPETEQAQLYLQQLDVDCVTRLLLDTDLPEGDLYDRLETSQPSGLLKNVLVHIGQPKAEPELAKPELAKPELAETLVLSANTPNESQSTGQTRALKTEKSSEPVAPSSAEGAEKSSSEPAKAGLDIPDSEGLNEPTMVVSGEGNRLATGAQQEQGPETDEGPATFWLEAELAEVMLEAYDGTPSGKGINGYLKANASGGSVLLASDNFELGFPELFLQPWSMQRTEGEVSWTIDGRNVEVFSNGLRLLMPEGEGLVYGDFGLTLNPDEHEDLLSLAIAMRDIPFQDVTRYVPFYEVGEDLFRWLEGSLKQGRVTNGVFYAYGSVEADSAERSFTSALRVDTDAGVLSFDPAWPPLEQLQAHVELQNDELWVSADVAQIAKTPLNDLRAYMPSVPKGEDPELTATANTVVEGELLNYWMSESPVSEHTGVVGEAIDIEGPLKVDLEVSVPMSDEDVGYKVITQMDGNTIHHALSGFSFTDVSGAISVSDTRGVYADDVSLKFLGRDTSLSMRTLTEEQAPELGGVTRLTFQGVAELSALLGHFDQAQVPGLEGGFAFDAQLDFPYDDNQVPRLSLVSDMKGVSRDWPSPFHKSKDGLEQLELSLLFEEKSTRLESLLRSKWGTLIKSQFRLSDDMPLAGKVHLSLKHNPLKKTPGRLSVDDAGVSISGDISRLKLAEWISFLERFESGEEDSEDDNPINLISVNVGVLDALDQRFSNVALKLERDAVGWWAAFDSEQAKGRVNLPTDTRMLGIELEHIHVHTSEETVSEDAEQDRLDPKEVPPMRFQADKVVVNDTHYGRWSTRVVKLNDGVRFDNLAGNLGGVSVSGLLNWRTSDDGQPSSYLELAMAGGDIEQFFKTIGKPAPVSSKKMSGDLAIVWPDHPQNFSAERISGTFKLKMDEGFLKTSDSKTGALRLLGILNPETIGRRLKLDFSDLYKSGIGYDTLEMNSAIEHGVLRLEPPMKISGPSSKYEIKGQTDLAKQSLNLEMYVELPVSNNVPLAALMLGSPTVGGAVWLVDKLLGSPLSSITSAKFNVTGTWDDPKLKAK